MKHTPETDAIILAHGPNKDAMRAAMRRAGYDITRRAAESRWRFLTIKDNHEGQANLGSDRPSVP